MSYANRDDFISSFKPYDSGYRFQYYLNTNSAMEKRDIFQENILKKLRCSELLRFWPVYFKIKDSLHCFLVNNM